MREVVLAGEGGKMHSAVVVGEPEGGRGGVVAIISRLPVVTAAQFGARHGEELAHCHPAFTTAVVACSGTRGDLNIRENLIV